MPGREEDMEVRIQGPLYSSLAASELDRIASDSKNNHELNMTYLDLLIALMLTTVASPGAGLLLRNYYNYQRLCIYFFPIFQVHILETPPGVHCLTLLIKLVH